MPAGHSGAMIEVQRRRIFRRRVLYELSVEVADVVDLTAPGALAAVGLTMDDIASDDHTACQRVGGAIAWLGRGGILVPSARRAGDNMVILMGPGGEAEIERVRAEILFDTDHAQARELRAARGSRYVPYLNVKTTPAARRSIPQSPESTLTVDLSPCESCGCP